MTCLKKIQNTEVFGSNFSSRTLTTTVDISGYSFKVVVKNIIQGKILEIEGVKNAGTINFDFSALETLKKSTYKLEYWGDFGALGKEPFLLEELSIVSAENATNCSNSDNLNFEINFEEISIPVTISKTINQFYLDYESLTPEQKAELKGDAFTYEDFTPAQIAELQKPATDKVEELNELETALTTSESLRVQNENARISSESIRNTNEIDRISSENSRQENEVSRQENENIRVLAESERKDTEAVRISNENTRISSENTRNTNEQSRLNAENNRVTAENSRSSAENIRITNETQRISNENDRKSAETSRVNAETNRATAETSRATSETTRVNSENTRISNENNRISAENSRVTAESSRVTAENARVTATATAIANAEAATNNANNAKGWQPLLVADTTTIAGKTLLKLQDWIGGTGTKPTTNVGQWQKGDGTYTSIASEANDIKGDRGSAILAEYTHNTNTVLPAVSSIDYANGIINFSAPHGFTGVPNFYQHKLIAIFNGVSIKDNYKAIPTGLLSNNSVALAEILSTTSIRVTNNADYRVFSIPNVNAANVDFSLWHFEYCYGNVSIPLTTPRKALRAVMHLKGQMGQPYFGVNTNRTSGTQDNSVDIGTVLGLGWGYIDKKFYLLDGILTALTEGTGNQINSSGGLTRVTYNTMNQWRVGNATELTGFVYAQIYPLIGNGSRITLFEL